MSNSICEELQVRLSNFSLRFRYRTASCEKLGLDFNNVTTVVYMIPIVLIKIVIYQTSLCDFNKGSEQLSTTRRRHFVWHLIQSEFPERATHKMKWNKIKQHSVLQITIQFCVRGSRQCGREFVWNITVISENLECCNRAGGERRLKGLSFNNSR